MSEPSSWYERVQEAVAAIGKRIGGRAPQVGLILGSGLGAYADDFDPRVVIPYSEIPHFPVSTVSGHAGALVVGTRGGMICAAMSGRVHIYEGHSAATVAFGTRVLIALGARTLIITNAAGGLRDQPGTLMLIADHINWMPDHPLRGPNDDRFGTRFPDMSAAYSPALRELARAAAARIGVAVTEGVYLAGGGPSYETPAEIRMYGRLGADAVGMSTVPEVIAARHMGASVLGISCITNWAAGISEQPLSHDEVEQTAAQVRPRFRALLDEILSSMKDVAA